MKNSPGSKDFKTPTINKYMKHIAASIALFLTTSVAQPVFSQQQTIQKEKVVLTEVIDSAELKKEVVTSFSKDIIEKYGEKQGLELIVKYMIEEINSIREENDLEPLKEDIVLSQVAQNYAKYLADNKHYSHYDLQGRDHRDRLKQAGYTGSPIGENVSPAVTLSQAMRSWMQSRGHRENMLDPDATKVGIGCDFMEINNRGIQSGRWVLLTGK